MNSGQIVQAIMVLNAARRSLRSEEAQGDTDMRVADDCSEIADVLRKELSKLGIEIQQDI